MRVKNLVSNQTSVLPPYNQDKTRNLILGILIAVLAIVYLGFEYFHEGDFFIYYQASKDFFLKKNIYTEFYGTCKCFPYLASPTLALILGIITWAPFYFASFIWKALSLFFLYRTWILIEGYFDLSVLSLKQYIAFILFSFFAISFVLYRNFHLNQFTIFILYCCLEGIHQINKGKKVGGSFIIAVGIICKIMPIVLIPYLIYRKNITSGLLVILFSLLLFCLPFIFYGADHTLMLLDHWRMTINPNKEENIFDVSTNDIHGIPALISTLFIDGLENEHTLHIRRHVLNLDRDIVRFLIQAIRLIFITGTLFFLRSLPFRSEPNKLKRLWEIGYILMITPLVFPQQRLYAFYFLFPAISYVIYHFISLQSDKKRNGNSLIYFFIFAIILFNLELIIGNYREFYWHYKTVTYSVLFIICIYFIIYPHFNREKNKIT